MRIASWNVNGFRAVVRKGVFLPFVAELEPDVVCLQETKTDQRASGLDLPGFAEHFHGAEKKGYSGTAVFTRRPPQRVTAGLPDTIAGEFGLSGDPFGDPAKEGRVLTVEFPEFRLVTVYTPNAKEDLARLDLRYKKWDPAFLAYVKELDRSKPVVFCGDLNVAHTEDDLANPKSNSGKKGFTIEEREGFQNFVDAGFVDTFRMFHQGNGHYTWWSHFAKARERNIGWRIDYILVSERLAPKVVSADIHPAIVGSDHCPVSVSIDV